MAAAVSSIQQRKVDEEAKDRLEFIPEIVEEKRNDSDGQPIVTKYIRGKLLGKVRYCASLRNTVGAKYMQHHNI